MSLYWEGIDSAGWYDYQYKDAQGYVLSIRRISPYDNEYTDNGWRLITGPQAENAGLHDIDFEAKDLRTAKKFAKKYAEETVMILILQGDLE